MQEVDSPNLNWGSFTWPNLHGQILDSILSYVDGITYVHKVNVYNYVRAGNLHDWTKKKFEMNS